MLKMSEVVGDGHMDNLAQPDPEYKSRPIILVISKDKEQAKYFWRDFLRDKYPKEARVKFVSRNDYALDGLSYENMTIIHVGEWWLNPAADRGAIQWYKKLGAKVVYEQV